VLGAKTHAKQQLRSLQTACKLFAVPFDVTTFDLQTGFVEFDASAAPIPVVSYEIDISPLNAGFPWYVVKTAAPPPLPCPHKHFLI